MGILFLPMRLTLIRLTKWNLLHLARLLAFSLAILSQKRHHAVRNSLHQTPSRKFWLRNRPSECKADVDNKWYIVQWDGAVVLREAEQCH